MAPPVSTITTDKHPPYVQAITELKAEGVLKKDMPHRQNQYLNNIIEQDHRRIKRRIRPMLGFKSFDRYHNAARSVSNGYDVKRAIYPTKKSLPRSGNLL